MTLTLAFDFSPQKAVWQWVGGHTGLLLSAFRGVPYIVEVVPCGDRWTCHAKGKFRLRSQALNKHRTFHVDGKQAEVPGLCRTMPMALIFRV